MWTDERLDDLATKVDAGFERMDRDMRDMRMLMFQLWGVNMLGIVTTIVAVIVTSA